MCKLTPPNYNAVTQHTHTGHLSTGHMFQTDITERANEHLNAFA